MSPELYEQPLSKWTGITKRYRCRFHNLSLAVELNEKGFKEGEWFCKQFENNGRVNKSAFDKFNKMKEIFEEGILYGFYGEDGNLKETPFENMGLDPAEKLINELYRNK